MQDSINAFNLAASGIAAKRLRLFATFPPEFAGLYFRNNLNVTD
jgi:hypothetical protein